MSQAQTNFPENGFEADKRSFPSSILDALPAHVALLDRRGVILTANEHWRRFAAENGASEDAYIGQSYVQACDDACSRGCAEGEIAARGIREVLARIRPHFEMEYPCHAPTELRWFRLMVSPSRDGDLYGAVVMHVNITARKLAELELQRAKEAAERQARQLRLLSDASARLLLHENPRELLDTLFQRMSAQLGLEIYLYYLMAPDCGHLALASMGGLPEDLEPQLRRLNLGEAVCGTVALERGRKVVEEVQRSMDPLHGLIRSLGITAYACHPLLAGGRLLGTLSFGTRRRPRFEPDELELMQTVCDQIATAVERSQLLDELRRRSGEAHQARETAEAANKAKDEFLAALSHELRTPLTPVLLTVEALQGNGRLPSELRADLERIRRNIEREARLIDDLLDVTRIARGKVRLRFEAVDVHALLRHAAETCAAETRERRPEVMLDLAASDSWTWGDSARLEQVFWNLLSNSLKFTGLDGSVRVRTWNDPEGRLRVEVNDTGIGIEAAVLPHIFNAFEQGGGHMTRRFGGLGLGLAISKSLVELHGGSIGAQSEGAGKGTAFTVTLDTARPAEGEVEPAASAGREPRRGLRLLLVEDHADTAEAMAELLLESGHRVAVAHSVTEALALAEAAVAGEEGSFDLVVSDLGLPDGSGLDLMRELVRRYGLRGIALSGYGTEQDVRDSLAAGFERHLVKPVGVRAIEAAIREVA